jgi:hypothetical protein
MAAGLVVDEADHLWLAIDDGPYRHTMVPFLAGGGEDIRLLIAGDLSQLQA